MLRASALAAALLSAACWHAQAGELSLDIGDLETAGFSLYGRQFGRVAAAASLFVARHPQYAAHSLRFDAMLVVGLWPRHLPDVWRAPE